MHTQFRRNFSYVSFTKVQKNVFANLSSLLNGVKELYGILKAHLKISQTLEPFK